LGFYESLSERLTTLGDQAAVDRVATRYARFAPPILGYATVEDYSDSVDYLPALATLNHDLKDVQRPWILKALLGRLPRGARLLEIGGGDAWVADLLARLGYETWLVDPYDGRDGGPADFERLRSRYPKVHFIRGVFPEALRQMSDASFDCIFSISVLEHIPDDAIGRVVEGLYAYTRGGFTIHAIDHVLKGAGAEAHLAKLATIVTGLGIGRGDLDRLLERLNDDPDSYFLSAEAHNRWRGTTPYQQFPMRRVVSIHLCAEIDKT
jgi:SAM-dependent methyltransferase